MDFPFGLLCTPERLLTSARTFSYPDLLIPNDFRLLSCPLPCLPAITSSAICEIVLDLLGLEVLGLLGLGLDAEGFLSLVVPVKVLTNFLAYVSTSSVNTLALSLFVPKPNSTNLYVIPALAVRLTLARLLRPLTPACPLWL